MIRSEIVSNKDELQRYRGVDYLRISITDRCNLRCIYCIPQKGVNWQPREEILSFEEIIRIVRILSLSGIKKLRITGGEPLVRKGLINFISELSRIPGIEEISLTTNGVLLPSMAEELRKSNLSSLNISLDTLKREKFERITGKDAFQQVIQGIEKVRGYGFSSIKINTLLMKGINDEEIIDFVNFALEKGFLLRFIEFMKVSPLWSERYYFPVDEAFKICKKSFNMQKVGHTGSGPAFYYRIGNSNLIGFIKTDEGICKRCTKLRLTSEGLLKLCLYENDGLALKSLLRGGKSDEEIKKAIDERLRVKGQINYRTWEGSSSYMYSIGG